MPKPLNQNIRFYFLFPVCPLWFICFYLVSFVVIIFLVYVESVGYAVNMPKFILALICVFISISVIAETVYKKTNPDGSVEFTDQNSIGSEEIKIRKPMTYSPPRLPSLNLPTKKLSPTFNYVLIINQPENDMVLVGKINVLVTVSVQPALLSGQGHQIRYELAGQSIVSQNTSETFKNVNRGTHNLTVGIVDKNGEAVSPIASRTFHMKRFFKKPAPPPPPKKLVSPAP